MMKPQSLLGALALLAVAVVPSLAQEPIKLGFITKFPVPFFATMENAAKDYACLLYTSPSPRD